jgi:hypothetical protein
MDFNITDIGSSGLVALVVIVTTVFGVIKGMVRMVFGLIALLISALGTYWGFMRGGPLMSGYFPDQPSWLPAVVGLVMGLAFFFISRAILGTILRPTKVIDGKTKNLGGLGGLVGIMTGVVAVAFAISATRYLGTIAEIDRLHQAINGKEVNKEAPVSPLIIAKNFIDDSKLGQMHQKFDFINDPSRAQLAKLKVLTQEQHAINLAAGGNRSVYDALAQSDVRKILATTPDLELAFIEDKHWGHLLDSQRLREVAQIPAAREVLLLAEIEEALGIAPKPLFPETPKSEKNDGKTAKK